MPHRNPSRGRGVLRRDLRPLTNAELADEEQRRAVAAVERPEGWGARRYGRCRRSRCTNFATHLVREYYVTGRAGRVSYREVLICADHARRYLDAPAAPSPPTTPAAAPSQE